MADKKKIESSKIDSLYQWISYDLQRLRGELVNEMKLSSAQVRSLYEGMRGEKDASAVAMEQEIRYGYKQNQNIYDGLASLLKNEVAERINSMEAKIATLDQLQTILSELEELKCSYQQLQTGYEGLSTTVSGDVLPKLEAIADKDEMKSVLEETVTVHSQQVLDAVAALPAPESVDYERITAEVGDKLLELLNELKASEAAPEEAEAAEELTVEVDYERIAGDTAAKVMESMPFAEQFDYNHIDEAIANAVAEAVNVDAIAEAIAAKMTAPAVDYDHLADVVVEKLAARGISADVILDEEGISKIADTVAEKVGATDSIDYDKVCLAAQAAQILPDPVDYDRVAEIVENKLDSIEKVVTLDEEGIDKIVGGVADELRNMTLVCEYEAEEAIEEGTEEAPVEEVVEEAVEEVVEEPVVEEVAEEVVEEATEEAPVEEAPVEEPVVEEELAVAVAPAYEEDMNGQLVDAETGLVVRLKRSFTAKMKQSEEQVKVYYSDIKNALTSYKKINSNVSWHGDRYNYGRETVAKIGINGKTLCFYLALDPNDPELKPTVYHQKDVGAQKAYESTPFMVKVKSDAAAKKALRLVGVLAQKLGAEEDESFQEVDYVAEYAYASTKRLFEEGDIKATKEKKVDFNF